MCCNSDLAPGKRIIKCTDTRLCQHVERNCNKQCVQRSKENSMAVMENGNLFTSLKCAYSQYIRYSLYRDPYNILDSSCSFDVENTDLYICANIQTTYYIWDAACIEWCWCVLGIVIARVWRLQIWWTNKGHEGGPKNNMANVTTLEPIDRMRKFPSRNSTLNYYGYISHHTKNNINWY